MNVRLTQEQQDVAHYLNALQQSSVTNMFGAAKYLQAQFGFTYNKAIDKLNWWMDNWDDLQTFEEDEKGH